MNCSNAPDKRKLKTEMFKLHTTMCTIIPSEYCKCGPAFFHYVACCMLHFGISIVFLIIFLAWRNNPKTAYQVNCPLWVGRFWVGQLVLQKQEVHQWSDVYNSIAIHMYTGFHFFHFCKRVEIPSENGMCCPHNRPHSLTRQGGNYLVASIRLSVFCTQRTWGRWYIPKRAQCRRALHRSGVFIHSTVDFEIILNKSDRGNLPIARKIK